MKNNVLGLLCFLIIAVAPAQVSDKFKKNKELGGIEEYEYQPNGLKILLLQDNSTPVVTVQVVYHVGSTNEVSGTTGATHLLEHLMFKGTPKFNKRKGTAIFPTLQNVGARMNATTWYDRTNYYETIPSDQIELALEIEADRMRNSLLLEEDKASEMTVVRNEFERGMNSPARLLQSQIWSVAYMASPYHHSTIGWRSDIENVPMEKLREFYDTYYWPNNATLTVVGDFQKDEVFRLVDKYFGKITRSPHEIPQPYTTEPEQLGPRKLVVKRPGKVGIVTRAYKIPGKRHEDYPALEVLSDLLAAGPSSILNKTYVDTGIALYARAGANAFKDAGLFTIDLGINSEKEHEDIDSKLITTIDSIKALDFNQDDIDRILSKKEAQNILYRDGSGVISSMLNEAIASGDWTGYVTDIEKLKKVTREDVKRVARKYLDINQSTTGYFIPENSDPKQGGNPGSQGEDKGSKMFFRDPGLVMGTEAEVSPRKEDDLKAVAGINSKIKRKEVAGIDVISLKTSAKDFVSVNGSLSIGDYMESGENELIPMLTAYMLNKGTQQKNKVEFSQALEKLGVHISASASDRNIHFSFKCLKKDIPEVISLFSEALKIPLFDNNEFNLLKGQLKGNMSEQLNDPGRQARIKLLQTIYKPGHPNYARSTEESLELLDKATIEEVKAFHKKYFGTASFRLVVVGDVDEEKVHTALKNNFSNWKGGVQEDLDVEKTDEVMEIASRKTEKVFIPEKSSAELLIGQYTGLNEKDPDYMAFYLANSILGSGFSGRLMATVRDNEGLTYGIGSGHNGDALTGGYWTVNGTFNPDLMDKGYESTMREINKWYADGVTRKELENIKSYLTGSYKVGMSTTRSLAGTLMNFVNKGYAPEYIYEYPSKIMEPGLDEVNKAIKKYLDPEKLVIVKAGTLGNND
ncbi:insulinase family protein [Sinomicrobium kalidii]|uniref:M16 family metallopeptidase n=1 Tax=Sinomicrobium kalidii TaxID=2900738 RepID=UPI001E62B82A|nr:pitrilysin family protein [Sinomicrobium kalidii]UGU14740.1 insulinase family protein [Sinomicrobium kalidii]